mmetsp:Transcript_13236/g.20670  ORF Transcript_13236/g.20670 Transcript_13236/m.20670 type:complete len:80 (-) Transcript_13236:7-246(-)
MRELENSELSMLEMMFSYKQQEAEEMITEAVKVTRDFHSGSMDPNNKNSKYEQQLMQKKQREQKAKRKQGARIDFSEVL